MNLFYLSYSWNNSRGELRKSFAYVGVAGRVSRDVIDQVVAKVEAENEGVVPHSVMIDFIYELAG